MRRRILSLALSLAMILGSMNPAIPAYAAQNPGEAAAAETFAGSEGDAAQSSGIREGDEASSGKVAGMGAPENGGSEDVLAGSETMENRGSEGALKDSDNLNGEDPADAGANQDGSGQDTDKSVEDGSDPASETAPAMPTDPENGTGSEEAAEITDDVIESGDSEAIGTPDTDPGASVEGAWEESPDIAPDAEKEFFFTIKDLYLVVGDALDNRDGHLNEIFEPKLIDEEGNEYELFDKTRIYPEDALTYTVEYRFYEDEKTLSEDDFSEMNPPEKDEAFENLKEYALETVPDARSLFVVMKAETSDEHTIYLVKEIPIKQADDALDEEKAEDALESAEVLIEKEDGLVKIAVDDDPEPGFDQNLVGFYDTEELLGVSFISPFKEIKVEAYVSKSRDGKNAKKIGETTIEKFPEEYKEDGDAANAYKQRYWKANAIKISRNDFDAGMNYIFGRFYTDEADPTKYVESENTITFNNIEGPAPEILEITPATTAAAVDGGAELKGSQNYSYMYLFKYGSSAYYGEDGTDKIRKIEEGGDYIHKKENLGAGHYRAAYCGTGGGYWVYELFADSKWLDFDVPVKEGVVTNLSVYDYHIGPGVTITDCNLTKGDQLSLGYEVESEGNVDRGVTFRSSDFKVVSVDASGNCKGLKVGSADVTVATVGKNAEGKNIEKTVHFDIHDPKEDGYGVFTVKSAKFKENPVKTYKEDGTVELEISFDKNIKSTGVTWHVDDPSVAQLMDGATPATTAFLDGVNGVAKATAKLNGAGKAVITATIGGAKTIACTLYVHGKSEDADDSP